MIAEIYSHMLYQLSYAEASRKPKPSAVVQWLGYLAFTQETRVQTPAAEQFSWACDNGDEGGVRTHASEEIAALTQRLRPLGHLATVPRQQTAV